MSTKEMLIESYNATRRDTQIDPSKPGPQFRELIGNDKHFSSYVKRLSEGLSDADKRPFKLLAENTRTRLLENSMFTTHSPYETLALPLLRVFYPRTIARELVTVIPMDKPEMIRGFMTAVFKRFGDATSYNAPSATDISRGPDVTVPITSMSSISTGEINILNVAGLNPDIAHVDRTFVITGVTFNPDSGSNENVSVNVSPTVSGHVTANVSHSNGESDTLTGQIDYNTGIVRLTSISGKITHVAYTAYISMEENTINPRAELKINNLRIVAKDRQISTEWSVQAEQDLRALFQADIQAEMVSVIGQQIVLDVDREIVNSLITANERMNGSDHTVTFDRKPDSNFTFGQKQWFENITVKLNDVSAKIYRDTNMAAANVIACNPVDAAIFESLNSYRFTGTSDTDGVTGYETATVNNGKWKVLTSAVVPQGKILTVYKPTEEMKAVYVFSPYVPAVLTPYPLGNKPSLTILSRYGTQLIRPAGIGVVNVVEST